MVAELSYSILTVLLFRFWRCIRFGTALTQQFECSSDRFIKVLLSIPNRISYGVGIRVEALDWRIADNGYIYGRPIPVILHQGPPLVLVQPPVSFQGGSWSARFTVKIYFGHL